MKNEEKILLVALVIVVTVGIIQVAVLYFGADEVKCNFLWCEFKSTISESRQDCFMNGERVDCRNTTEEILEMIK